MEQIKITKIVSKTTTTGKPYKMCEVLYQGNTERVNIWSNAPDFANLQEGSVIVGKMTKEGQYWNISFEGQNSAPRASQGFKTAQIEATMDKKAHNIEKAQENRSEGVKISATMRDAVQCAIVAYGKDPTRLNTLEDEIIYWRKWLWKHWDDPTTEAIYPD